MIKMLLWTNLILVVFIFFVFPLLIAFIAALKGKQPKREDIEPSVSVIIPMHNEERVVKEKVDNLFLLDYPTDKLEILFVLDGCTDKTKEHLLEYKNSRLKIFDNTERGGKVAALNNAVPRTNGEIIVFTDANSIHERDALRKLVRNFADESVGCVSGKLVYTSVDRTVVGKGENLYWKNEDFIKKQESKLGKLLVTSGSIQAVRRDVYPYPDPEIADDFSIPLLIQAQGHKVLYEPEAIVYEIATQSLVEEFNQKVRIVAQGMKGFARLWRLLLELSPIGIFELLFHKVLRWFVGFYLIVIYLVNMALWDGGFYSGLFMLQTVFYVLALAGFLLRHKTKIRILYIPFYFCLINFASIAAAYKFLKGEQTRTWDKAHTTRVKVIEVKA